MAALAPILLDVGILRQFSGGDTFYLGGSVAGGGGSVFQHSNIAAYSTTNSVQYVVQLATSTTVNRNAFIMATSFNNVTDATRNSLVQFYTQKTGALTEVLRFDGTKTGFNGPLYRNSPMERLVYSSTVVDPADTFIAMKDGTPTSPSAAATYAKPMFYLERHTDNPTKGEYANWGNQRLSPTALIELVAYGTEQGCPTAMATRTYTTAGAPTQSVTSLTRSGATATATTATAHGLSANEAVTIFDAVQPEYNGTHRVTVIDATNFSFTVTGTPTTPATGTILMSSAQPLHGLAVLVESNPGGGGRNREMFGGNYVLSFPSGTKPINFVGIEVDLQPSQSCANVRPGTGNSDNFTAYWAQSASAAGPGGYTCNTAFYASGTGPGGWWYGMVLDCNFQDTAAFIRNTLSTAARGLYVELGTSGAAGKVITGYANAGAREQFRVDDDASNAVWCLLGGAIKKLELGAADSGGTGYKLVRVTN